MMVGTGIIHVIIGELYMIKIFIKKIIQPRHASEDVNFLTCA